MKHLILLALLAATAPALRAQEVAPAKTQLAQLDPAARDLFARTAARYQKFRSFESLISWKIGPAGKGLEPRRFRVQMTIDGKFVVGEEFPDKSWRKAICDGKTLVEFRSEFPNTYTRTSVKSAVYLDLAPQLEATLRSVDIEGPLISLLLGNDFSAALLDPNFEGLELQDEGALKIVTILTRAPQGHPRQGSIGSVKLWIDPQTTTLDHVAVAEADKNVFTESYAQTHFDPKLDPAIFRAVAPLNYKLVANFADESTNGLTPPDIAVQ